MRQELVVQIIAELMYNNTDFLTGKPNRMANRENEKIIQEFRQRRSRQLYAIGAAVFLLLVVLWRHSHPGILFGELSRGVVVLWEVVIIAGFVVFSALNWRCPACGRYLGGDINMRRCRRCGAHFC